MGGQGLLEIKFEPRRLQLVGSLLGAQGALHRGRQAHEPSEGADLLHQTGVEQPVIGHSGRRQCKTATGGRAAVDRENQHGSVVAPVSSDHPDSLHAVSKKGRECGHQINEDPTQQGDLGRLDTHRAIVDVAGEADTDRVEDDVVADADEVD